MLALACFEESGSWWFLAGFSDNVSHILVWKLHRGLDPEKLSPSSGLTKTKMSVYIDVMSMT
jgi:hypothetical protein